MKYNFILLLLLFPFLFLINSCRPHPSCCGVFPNYGSWVSLNVNSTNNSLANSAAFVIGNSAYVGTGVDYQNKRYNTFYKFTATDSSWVQVASCPGVPRSSSVAFTINGLGYVGSGYDGVNALSDFWQYTPQTNAWIQVASIGDSAGMKPRYDAVGFSINQNGYVSTGNDGTNYLNDFWQYNPLTNKWIQKLNFPGLKRTKATAFVYNNKGFIVTGLSENNTLPTDFFSYDPSQPDTIAWTKLRQISNVSTATYDDGYFSIARYGAASFVILNTKNVDGADWAFVTTGSNGTLLNGTWAYNLTNDLWNTVEAFSGNARTGATGFSVANKGFIYSGNNGTNFYGDLWEYIPY